MNLGRAVSRWYSRFPKLAFTSLADEMFIQKKNSNELYDVDGNYSVEPANQTRFPCERSAKVGETVALPPF